MAHIIYEQEIPVLLETLAKEYIIYIPAEKDLSSFSGQYDFTEFEKGVRLALGYPTTVLPPTKYLFPETETVFSYKEGKVVEPIFEKQIIFGVSYDDLLGIARLDKVFAEPTNDEVYRRRRGKTVIVGADRYSPPNDVPFDLYLQEIEEGVYAGFAGTKIGKKILSMPEFKKQNTKVPSVSHKKDPLLSDPDLARAVEKSKDHPIWKELTKSCLACGICSYVCPLCYCFEAEDEINLCQNGEGERCRSWDSCMLKNFATTTHHNFREEQKDRIYNWYFHKFVRMPAEYGFSGCVDCNRCIVFCPAKINYQEVLKKVLADYKKRPKK